MRTRFPLLAAVFAAALVAGCGDSAKKCPTESPQVNNVPGNCTVAVGQPVTFPLQLCPRCNQSLTGCNVDMSSANASGGTIFLDPVVEVCDSGTSCPPSCLANGATCSFTPPTSNTGVSYTVTVYDPGTNGPRSTTITTGSSTSCPTSI